MNDVIRDTRSEPKSQASLPGGVVMSVHQTNEEDCRSALEHVSFARLACARDNRPYLRRTQCQEQVGGDSRLPGDDLHQQPWLFTLGHNR
jgi:hypothetical protein